MRLWHQALIPYLPRQQLLGQHRECCALRGAGWGRPHSVVNYVFKYDPIYLIVYHQLIMEEMIKRGYHPDEIWNNYNYRGKQLGEQSNWANSSLLPDLQKKIENKEMIYQEHNNDYLRECLDNLSSKNIEIKIAET